MVWLKGLLKELQVPQPQTPIIWCDNLSTVSLSVNPIQHSRMKHIELDLYFVVQHVSAYDQTIDIFTKPLSLSSFYRLCDKLSVEAKHPLSFYA